MTVFLANMFLGCFLFGFVFTIGSLLFGMEHHHGGHGGGNGHSGHGAHGAHGDHGGDVSDGTSGDGHGFSLSSLINLNTIVMFMTWFGGVGFLMMYSGVTGTIVVLTSSVLAGLAGAIGVFLFLNQFLMKMETRMNPADYHLPGTLARITSSIKPDSCGEIMYVQGGTRKTSGARSDEDSTHPQGQEVVIVRVEKGIAYVRSVEAHFSGQA